MSVAEHGAYRLLMDHYYATRKPLPEDFAYLCRVARCHSRYEKACLRTVLKTYFVIINQYVTHARIDKEILKYQQTVDANRNASAMRWHANRISPPEVRSQKSEETKSTTSAVDEKNARPPPKKNGHAIDFDWPTFKFLGIQPGDMARWQEAYPAIPVPDEIDRAAAWLQANPANRKSNYMRFLNNWFLRSQERAGRIK